jgi:hypothetical protein
MEQQKATLRTRRYLPAGWGRYDCHHLTSSTDMEWSLGPDNVLRATVTMDRYTFEVLDVSKWNTQKRTANVTFRYRPQRAGQHSVEYRIRFDRKWQWKQFYDNYLSAYAADARRQIPATPELDAVVARHFAGARNRIECIRELRTVAPGYRLPQAKNYVDERWGCKPAMLATPAEFTEADNIHAKGMGILLEWTSEGDDHGK